MTKFDISLSFDKAEYLDTQLYLFFDSLKNNIPEDVVIHIVTNRNTVEDPVIQYIKKNTKNPLHFYHKEPFPDLESRCQYMFHCFDVSPTKKWLIKMEADFLILGNLSILEEILDDDYDLILEPENRKIFDDNTADRLWRVIYREMGIKKPDFKIQFRENKETGLPLFGTGMVCVKTKLLKEINENWVPLIKKCEKWISYNVHPNEMAITGLILDKGWKWKFYDAKYKFNPIGHFRDGQFPSLKLKHNCKLPEDTLILDYHRPMWLYHVGRYNSDVMEILNRNKERIPEEWLKLTNEQFLEGVSL